MMDYFEDQTFQNINFIDSPLHKGEYEYCKFLQCNFEGVNLNNYKFIDCQFVDCNLSLAKIEQCSFQDILFKNCKLLGLRFDSINPFNIQLRFEESSLDHSSFYNCIIKGTVFSNCRLHQVDFENAQLTNASFAGSDMKDAQFINSNLEKVDFRESKNLILDPSINKVKGAKINLNSLPGLLLKYKLSISI